MLPFLFIFGEISVEIYIFLINLLYAYCKIHHHAIRHNYGLIVIALCCEIAKENVASDVYHQLDQP